MAGARRGHVVIRGQVKGRTGMWKGGGGVDGAQDSPTYKTEASFLKKLLPNGSLWVGAGAYLRVWQSGEAYHRT
ncbi:hypothetical protein E2C01_000617 [Portunus trituberculatus]|uniref:Uncharacterized protein n=1 Tax=Portunus trituberculatus TaxID=210409 RepID=A0A5B7CF63_PORTR|nr:hypothetical protein [Portunus trituberculatus]